MADGRNLPIRWSQTENIRWSVKLPGWGTSSPVVHGTRVFVTSHLKDKKSLLTLCFNRKDGKELWRHDFGLGPLLVDHHGQKDILVPGQNRLTAFDAKTHAELWRYGEGEGPFNGEIISSPVYGDGIVFLQLWRESKIYAIRLLGEGKPPQTVWVSKKPGPVESSVLYYRGLLYALMDNGVLFCLDGKTGEELYRERLGGACNSSPVASDGHIYLSDNDGKTFVVRAGKEFRLLETNPLVERISASPAITGDWLIYRTDSHLYCIGAK